MRRPDASIILTLTSPKLECSISQAAVCYALMLSALIVWPQQLSESTSIIDHAWGKRRSSARTGDHANLVALSLGLISTSNHPHMHFPTFIYANMKRNPPE